ncbi:response regulator [Lachnospiraceae bacterium ZAX-1]
MKTVAIVDTDVKNLDKCKKMLLGSKQEFRCVFFQYPEEAIEYLNSNKVTVLVCELNMNVMSGKEVLEMYQMLSPETVQIAMGLIKTTDIPETLKTINEASVFKLILKPFLLPEDITKPIIAALNYYDLKSSEEKSQQSILEKLEKLEKLDSDYSEAAKLLEEENENYASLYDASIGILRVNLKQGRDVLSENEIDCMIMLFGDIFKEFMRYYIFDLKRYDYYEKYLYDLYHYPEKKRQFLIHYKLVNPIPDIIMQKIAFSMFLLGYMCASLLVKYFAITVIEEEERFYVVKFVCGYKQKDAKDDSPFREKSTHVQQNLHEGIRKILSSLSYKAIKGGKDNPFSAKVYYKKETP